MTSFFGKLKSQNASAPAVGASTAKKDAHAPLPTPLERMLANAGPIRNDGSDKFFGMENFGNSCYCNSILQCLYYSVPFREHVLSYPRRSNPEAVAYAQLHAPPRVPPNQQNGTAKKPPGPASARNAGTPPQQQKPEDKDSPEYKKKQAITTGPILNMTYDNSQDYDMPESLFTSLKDIFEAIVLTQSRMGVVSGHRFLEVLRKENEMFRSAMHQDAHEFLNLLLNTVVENIEDHDRKLIAQKKGEEPPPAIEEPVDVSRTESGTVSFPSILPVPAANSPTKWLHGLFEGTLTSETRCLTCENVSQRDEPFLDLSVDLEQHSSVTACLRRFSEEEMLCERNKFHCDNCGGLQEAEKRMKIKRLPRILALHLKRFKYTEDFGRLQKLFHKVVYPYHLRLFNTTDDAEDPDRVYELYAVVVHIGGGPYHGHYVAVIKTQDRGWLLFDDEMVEPVDKNFVRNFFGDKPGLACAYVLFYQETTLEAVQKEQRMEGKRRASQDLTTPLSAEAKRSAELHRVETFSPLSSPVSPAESAQFAVLDHAVTAPAQFKANGHVETPQSPPLTTVRPTSPVVQSKKERAKEEKARKAAEKQAEKERQEAERQRRKELANKITEAHKRQEAELKAALEASRATKAEEDKRNALERAHTMQANGSSPSGLDRFKRSKSLRFGSLTKRDKPPSNPSEEHIVPPVSTDGTEPAGKEKEKKNRFSIRKKSFGVLSSS
ncbi:ubiquitin thiolesterase [Cladophialophora psammophila CBS 110553]|uniref:Ubiquitin carboxyl-terminal hydrolase n=1 Tax=Cladophialophora psammophila CBS 110553 TaxID=1182543 RepID=W9X1U7_9EURO|nr:ubiquitin thiolesterase [Cladophialophora psammophila CBS 110553]EXJ74173.1 ubiquitin thiolesterase [Cladophialophora psammophila CBS 110553]